MPRSLLRGSLLRSQPAGIRAWRLVSSPRLITASQNPVDPLAQNGQVEWFFHDASNHQFFVFLLIDFLRVSGQHHNFSCKTLCSEAAHQIEARTSDHLVIGDDEIKGGLSFVEQFQGFLGILGGESMVPSEFQNNSQCCPAAGFIVNSKNV